MKNLQPTILTDPAATFLESSNMMNGFFILLVYLVIFFIIALFVGFSFSYFRQRKKLQAGQLVTDDEYAQDLKSNQTFAFDQVKSQIIEIEGPDDSFSIRYAWVNENNKPVVVFIHGIGSSINCWRDMYRVFLSDFRVLVLDLPGFGYSSKNSSSNYDLETQTKRIRSFLDQLKIENCYVVAHSMGAVLACRLASLEPERFIKLSLLAPGFGYKLKFLNPKFILQASHRVKSWIVTEKFVERIFRYNSNRLHKEKSQNEWRSIIRASYLPYHRSPDSVVTFAKSLQLLKDPNIESHFRNLKMPIQMFYCDRDRVVSNRAIRRFASLNANAHCLRLQESSHLLMYEDGEELSRKIQSFFSRL